MATSSLWSVTVLMSPVMAETAKGHRHVQPALTILVSECILTFMITLCFRYGDCGVPSVMQNPSVSTPSCFMTYFQCIESSSVVKEVKMYFVSYSMGL